MTKTLSFRQKTQKNLGFTKRSNKTQQNNNKIEVISVGGHQISNKKEIAEEFNNFFTAAGAKISNTINPTSLDPNDFIPPNPNPPELEFGLVSPAVIVTTIKAFVSKSSTDIDGLSTRLLKQIATEISIALSHIFNLSIQSGIFPNKFKTSRTVPIFKAGNSKLCDNYRPIFHTTFFV